MCHGYQFKNLKLRMAGCSFILFAEIVNTSLSRNSPTRSVICQSFFGLLSPILQLQDEPVIESGPQGPIWHRPPLRSGAISTIGGITFGDFGMGTSQGVVPLPHVVVVGPVVVV